MWVGRCGGRCWVLWSGEAGSLVVRAVGWGAVAGRSGSSVVIRLGSGGCGLWQLAVPCGRRAGLVCGVESGFLVSAACDDRECLPRVT